MQFYYFSNSAPDAQVVLNRGTQFQIDISESIRSFNTSNNINDIVGSFNILLDNTNDRFVDRYGYVNILKMSSVEIFVKDVSAFGGAPTDNVGSYINTQNGQTLNDIINENYGFEISVDIREQYIQAIIQTNPEILTNQSNGDTILDGGLVLKLVPVIVQYKKIFLGVITTVNQNFSAGNPLTLSLSGKSIGYWLESSTVNIAPAIFETTVSNTTPTPYSNKFAQSTALEIFRQLISFSTSDLLAVSDYSLNTLDTSREAVLLNGENSIDNTLVSLGGNPLKDPETGELVRIGRKNTSLVTRLKDIKIKKENMLSNGESLTSKKSGSAVWASDSKKYLFAKNKLLNFRSNLQSQINLIDNNNLISQQLKNARKLQLSKQESSLIESLNAAETAITNNSAFKNDANILDNYEEELQTAANQLKSVGVNSILKQFGIIDHWRKIFQNIVLEVADSQYLEKVYPFKWGLKAPNRMDGDYLSKDQVARQIATNLFFEFYFDTNGHFILKPPLYNVGVADNNPVYIIEEEDLVTFNLNDTVEGIITRVGVTGDVLQPVTLEKEIIYNVHQDLNLIRDFGYHNVELQSLIFIRNNQDCKDFGEAFMAKNNQELLNASVTILGRPDIRLGVAVYLKPRDTVYYIKGISHDFEVGSGYTTTLTLTGGRRIVTGFFVESDVNTVSTEIINNQKVETLVPNTQGSKINHYILTNSTNIEQFMITNFDNKTPSVLILKNVFVVTSNPNVGYVGLIVDNNSPILQSINIAKFLRIASFSLDAQSQQILDNTGANISSIAQTFLKDTFSHFLDNTSGSDDLPILSGGLGDKFDIVAFRNDSVKLKRIGLQFTNEILNQFIEETLTDIKDSADSKKSSNDRHAVLQLNANARVLNQLINDLDKSGSYKPFTDDDGRELPTRLDYGRTISIENTQASISKSLNEIDSKIMPTVTANTNIKAKPIVRKSKNYSDPSFQSVTPTAKTLTTASDLTILNTFTKNKT